MAEVTWSTEPGDAAQIDRMIYRPEQTLTFVVTTRGVNGEPDASLSVDYAEVRVRYERTAP